MTATDSPDPLAARRRPALVIAGSLLVAELALIGLLYKHVIDFTCLDNWPPAVCGGASGALVAVYCLAAAVALMALVRPAPFRRLFAEAGARTAPLLLNAAGAGIALLPVAVMHDGVGTGIIPAILSAWSVGMALILSGLALYAAPLARWRGFVGAEASRLLPVAALGLGAPVLAVQIRPLWQLDGIADLTFRAVAGTIEGLGYAVNIYPAEKAIGAGDFYISVAPVCSGVEGIALVSIFVTIYLWLFRHDLRFPRVLLLYPVGIAASAAFNVVRISALLVIGLEGNPELAVGGFHSHAGWLMFTLVAFGLIALAQTVPGLRRAPAASGERGSAAGGTATPAPRLCEDPIAARILPFAVFMFSALLAQAFSQSPGVVYPLRVLAMAAALAVFWPVLFRLAWRVDPVAVGAGVAVGLVWVAVPVAETDGLPPYGDLAGSALVAWFVLRGVGTVVLVPVIEELFFRGYLERRLRLGEGRAWTVAAALATAILFAALHDRWVLAFGAGLVFSWAALRRGNITDAIAAHAASNIVVYGAAVAAGNLAMI